MSPERRGLGSEAELLLPGRVALERGGRLTLERGGRLTLERGGRLTLERGGRPTLAQGGRPVEEGPLDALAPRSQPEPERNRSVVARAGLSRCCAGWIAEQVHAWSHS